MDWELYLLRAKVSRKIIKAIESGKMVRADTCELCDESPPPITVTEGSGFTYKRTRIVAHHWRGYEGDAALDVWHICQRCNAILRGPRFHNGSVTKEQARQFILDARNAPPKVKSEKCKFVYESGQRCGIYASKKHNGYCYPHRHFAKLS